MKCGIHILCDDLTKFLKFLLEEILPNEKYNGKF